MQKTIPFKKEMPFKSEVSEITSISLEHTLHKEKENLVTGIFTISGDYKVIDTSNIIDHFSFEIPFDIHIDDKYDLEKANVDIDDFYYEIINNKSLMINIDVLLDKIEEKEIRISKEKAIEELEQLEKELEEDNEVEERKEEKEIERNSEIEERKEEKELERNSELEKRKKEKTSNIEIQESNIETASEINLAQDIEVSQSESVSIEPVSTIFDSFDNKESSSSVYKVYMVREEDSLESILAKYKVSKEELEKYNNLKEMKKGDKLIIPTVEIEKV